MPIDTSNFSFQGIGVVDATLTSGCTDPTALNFNPLAVIEDGSCIPFVYGCMDPAADNYDCANGNTPAIGNSCGDGVNFDDGSCDYTSSLVYGCIDVTACNYDSTANTDDGSCNLPDGCTDPAADNYDASATCDDGSCTYPNPVLGCTDPTAFNYDSTANTDDGSCLYITSGCTDPLACNYDASATVDDGSCILPDGCVDPLYLEYDPLVTCPDNTNDCSTLIVTGCMDCGTYWESLAANAGQYCDGVSAATSEGSFNYNPLANVDTGCVAVVYGCTDPTFCAYDPAANVNDGSCIASGIPGCNDPTACNYDPTAGCDDGSCIPGIPGCTDDTEGDYADINGLCSHNNWLTNYSVGAGNPCDNLLDGYDASNYDPNATCDDGSCLYPGCTDLTATNYDSTANQDDGSCYLCSTLQIGDDFQGGIIFYFNNGYDGCDGGLIVSTGGGSGTGIWGCQGTEIGTNAGIGTGEQNTANILSGCNVVGTAAYKVMMLNTPGISGQPIFNGYNDWFLPSMDELAEAMATVGTGQTGGTNSNGDSLVNIAGFASSNYWTSTEGPNINLATAEDMAHAHPSTAWFDGSYTPTGWTLHYKDSFTNLFRAIRSF